MGNRPQTVAAPADYDFEWEVLCRNAESRSRGPGAYAGEVTCAETWDALLHMEDAVLIDVRTAPEWQFVGLPDLSGVPGRLLTLSWKIYPSFVVNPSFIAEVKSEGIAEDAPLFFLCRSGGRSLDAAVAMTQAGYRYCFNILDGFEGEPDTARRRGTQGGWKASGLPWIQG